MAEALAYEARRTCACPSQLFHEYDCPRLHSEIHALPKELPPGASVSARRGHVAARLQGKPMDPAHARGVARALLVAADEAERQEANDVAG